MPAKNIFFEADVCVCVCVQYCYAWYYELMPTKIFWGNANLHAVKFELMPVKKNNFFYKAMRKIQLRAKSLGQKSK